MTYIGAPHIWYGDEIGMQGAQDPDCRRPFNWRYSEDKDLIDLRELYKKLIRIRRENEALTLGNFDTILIHERIYSYLRSKNDNQILCVHELAECRRCVRGNRQRRR